jgi:hypothetical protein
VKEGSFPGLNMVLLYAADRPDVLIPGKKVVCSRETKESDPPDRAIIVFMSWWELNEYSQGRAS